MANDNYCLMVVNIKSKQTNHHFDYSRHRGRRWLVTTFVHQDNGTTLAHCETFPNLVMIFVLIFGRFGASLHNLFSAYCSLGNSACSTMPTKQWQLIFGHRKIRTNVKTRTGVTHERRVGMESNANKTY